MANGSSQSSEYVFWWRDTIISAVVSTIISIFLSLKIAEYLKTFFGDVSEVEYVILHLIVFLTFTVVIFGLARMIYYFLRSKKDLKLTLTHYFKEVPLSISPLTIIIPVFLAIFLGASIFAIKESDATSLDIKQISISFFCLAIVFGFSLWVAINTFYRKWVVEASSNIAQVLLEKRSGLLSYTEETNKDEKISDVLYSLHNCSFIFVWGNRMKNIIGRGYKDNVTERLLTTLEDNKEIYVLLQCPFCRKVKDRAIALGVEYDQTYMDDSIESLSNILAVKIITEEYPEANLGKIHIGIAHGRPYLRSILYGHLYDNSIYTPLQISMETLGSRHYRPACQQYVEDAVEWGGFLLQEYPPLTHGCYAPLYRASTVTHGGIWEGLRSRFARAFNKSIQLDSPFSAWPEKAVRHLAVDLGLPKRKLTKYSKHELLDYIRDNNNFNSFHEEIKRSAQTKFNGIKGKFDTHTSLRKDEQIVLKRSRQSIVSTNSEVEVTSQETGEKKVKETEE